MTTASGIEKLPATEQHDFLVRLSRGEKNLSTLLSKRLYELSARERDPEENRHLERRTISSLVKLVEEWHQNKKQEESRKAEIVRQKKLEALAAKKNKVWEEVYTLIEEKKSNAYDQAVDLLNDLHALAEYQGEWLLFNQHIDKIRKNYSNRSALLRRMRNSRLIKE